MDDRIQKTLGELSLIKEAVAELYAELSDGKKDDFLDLSSSIRTVLEQLKVEGKKQAGDHHGLKLAEAAESTMDSLDRVIRYSLCNIPLAKEKILYELIPFAEDMYASYYFWTCIFDHKERWDDYYSKEIPALFEGTYLKQAKEQGKYKYDISICVLAYNKLEFTQMCVDSLLKHLPPSLNCELLLVNHGSSDETKEYFESIRPTKQIDIKINGAFLHTIGRAIEGRFFLFVSNDVLVTEHAIENMYKTLEEDENIALVVPSTPNVSNLQTIPAQYSSPEEMFVWAEQNNKYDPYRHEVRTRLVNPIHMSRTEYTEQCLSFAYRINVDGESVSFPDDIQALLLRRKGYKLVLAKDAFCYHYGRVTIKEEMKSRVQSKEEEEALYTKGQKDFEELFGIDPWGTGYCYDPFFMDFDCKYDGHVEVLGINTGMGSNPLKIKEIYKEKKHNLDVKLTIADRKEVYFEDVKAFADETVFVENVPAVFEKFAGKKFNYIVFEEPFSENGETLTTMEKLAELLVPDGELYIKVGKEVNSPVYTCIMPNSDKYKSYWVRLIKN